MTPEFIAWLKQDAQRVLLMEVGVQVGGSETTRYLSTAGYVSGPADTPANTPYLGRIVGGFSFSRSLSIEGSGSVSYGDITLDNTDGALDGWLSDVWAKRAVRMYMGSPTWARSNFVQVFEGSVDDVEATDQSSIAIRIRDRLSTLDGPISTEVVGGSGSNADEPLPISLGECFNVSPLLLSETGLETYRVNNAAVEQIIEVRDNGYPVSVSKDASAGTFTLQYRRWGQITCDVQGATVSGQYRNDVGGLIEWLATSIGNSNKLQTSEIDAANIDAFRAACPQPVGRWLDGRENRLSVMQELADSVGATVSTNALGKLQIIRLGFGSPTQTITSADMEFGSLDPIMRPTIRGKMRLAGSNNWTEQRKDSLANALEANQVTLLSEAKTTRVASDASVMAAYKQNDTEGDVETLMVVDSDIEAEAQRRLNLWKVPRTVFRFAGFANLIALSLGDTITIQHPRLGLAAGKLAIVTSVDIDYVGGRVNVEVLV